MAEPPPTPSQEPVVRLDGIHKRFGGVHALRGVHLTIPSPGSVHGLIGENGSGKSTLLRILSGQIQPDDGLIELDGEGVVLHSPSSALRRGIAVVSQETAVAPTLSITENVLIGRRLVRRPWGVDWRASNRLAAEILLRLGLDLPPTQLVAELAPDQRQMVEIARALSMDARVLILDEPTSSLTDDEVNTLFQVVNRLKAQGLTTILVSHRLPEMFRMCDSITVLRDGKTVGQGPMSGYDMDSLVEVMVGSSAFEAPSAVTTRDRRPAIRPLLEVRDATVEGRVNHASLTVGHGEIVGLAGLVGAGRSELLEAIFGVRPLDEGSFNVDGHPYHPSIRASLRHGIGFVAPDRATQGLVQSSSIRANLMMAAQAHHARWRRPPRRAERQQILALQQRLRIRNAEPDAVVSTLSGGNQQKVALGRWVAAGSELLLLDEPTRGVDIAAKNEIHELLRELAQQGAGLLVSSSDNPELLSLCHRIIVMFRGAVVADLSGSEADELTIARIAGGQL